VGGRRRARRRRRGRKEVFLKWPTTFSLGRRTAATAGTVGRRLSDEIPLGMRWERGRQIVEFTGATVGATVTGGRQWGDWGGLRAAFMSQRWVGGWKAMVLMVKKYKETEEGMEMRMAKIV
jgi:hypothetical protein